eukprot:UN07599
MFTGKVHEIKFITIIPITSSEKQLSVFYSFLLALKN